MAICEDFFLWGARLTELFQVQVENVDVKNQEYHTTILKGSNPNEVTKVILSEVLPLCKEMIHGAKPNNHLFSSGLKASGDKISLIKLQNVGVDWLSNQIRFWNRKERLTKLRPISYSKNTLFWVYYLRIRLCCLLHVPIPKQHQFIERTKKRMSLNN